ncbi:transposase [Halomicronema sp. CCY15110]|uniref:transposase n=1 Tax=Halomicronema sp. CCY15110 TaxID=2767773 RepID=UPI0035CD33AE
MPPNVAFYFQPPYSPELNPIEQLWALLKGHLANRLWFDLDELPQLSRGHDLGGNATSG